MNNVAMIQNEIVRSVLSLLILFGTDLPFFIKILAIIFLDITDLDLPNKLDSSSPELFNEYEEYDKVGDFEIYLFLYIYYMKYVVSPAPLKALISFLFFYRLIGVFIYWKTGDRRIFIYFPNFFLEFLLAIAILEFIGYPYPQYFKLYMIVFFVVFIYKIAQEIYIHG
jgi:hypothetical protein